MRVGWSSLESAVSPRLANPLLALVFRTAYPGSRPTRATTGVGVTCVRCEPLDQGRGFLGRTVAPHAVGPGSQVRLRGMGKLREQQRISSEHPELPELARGGSDLERLPDQALDRGPLGVGGRAQRDEP